MRIRCMTIADYDQVYLLWIHTPGMGLNQLDDSKEGIEKYLRRNRGTCFVAEEGGRIIGAILSGHDGRRGFIYHTAVLEAYRKQGIGKKLVSEALRALDKEGIHKVALVAFERNQSGNTFWEAVGFEQRTDLVYRNKTLHEFQIINT